MLQTAFIFQSFYSHSVQKEKQYCFPTRERLVIFLHYLVENYSKNAHIFSNCSSLDARLNEFCQFKTKSFVCQSASGQQQKVCCSSEYIRTAYEVTFKTKLLVPYSKTITNNSVSKCSLSLLKAKNEYTQYIKAFQILLCGMFSNFR